MNSSLYTTYASRKPYGWGGGGTTVGGGGWALWTTDSVSFPVSTQSIVDSELADARGTIDFWVSDIYPDTPITGVTGLAQSGINAGYYAQRDSSCCSGYVKHAVLLQPDWVASPNFKTDAVWANNGAWEAWLINEFKDRNYMRINGLPVVYVFDPNTWNLNGNTIANWLVIKAAIGPIYAVGAGTIGTTAWTAMQLNGGSSYDGGLGAAPTGNGQHPWSDQVAKDQGNAGQAGFDVIETVNVWNDGRARANSETTRAWSDAPTVPDEITAFAFAKSTNAKIIMTSPRTEIDETGPMLRTIQDGRRWLDPIDWAIDSKARPGTYTYEIDPRAKYATQTGTWTRTNGIAGAYDGDVVCSSTTSDVITVPCDSHLLGSASSASVEFMVQKATTYGIADFTDNGVSQGTVDTGGSTTQHASVKTVTCASGHTLGFAVTGTHSIGSGNTVCLDSFRVTYAP